MFLCSTRKLNVPLFYYHNAIDMLLLTNKLNLSISYETKKLLTITKIFITVTNIFIFIISVSLITYYFVYSQVMFFPYKNVAVVLAIVASFFFSFHIQHLPYYSGRSK